MRFQNSVFFIHSIKVVAKSFLNLAAISQITRKLRPKSTKISVLMQNKVLKTSYFIPFFDILFRFCMKCEKQLEFEFKNGFFSCEVAKLMGQLHEIKDGLWQLTAVINCCALSSTAVNCCQLLPTTVNSRQIFVFIKSSTGGS